MNGIYDDLRDAIEEMVEEDIGMVGDLPLSTRRVLDAFNALPGVNQIEDN